MEADEQRENQFIHEPKGNEKMDPAVHRLTNQTRKKKKHEETWRKDWKAERKQIVQGSKLEGEKQQDLNIKTEVETH